MTLLIEAKEIEALVTDDVATDAARAAVDAEASGRAHAPTRTDVASGHGFLRVMPAVLRDRMGVKVMSLAEGVGTRYLMALFDVPSGSLLALLDADELTRLRTAATTVVAAGAMVDRPPTHLAVVGSGFEAEGHLRAFARAWQLRTASVYSRDEGRRVRFAARMSADLGIDVAAASTLREAVAGSEVIVLATKSSTPVVDGTAIPRDAVVLSIGSTRPDLRELDHATMARAATLVVDDRDQVRSESGDIIEGLRATALTDERIRTVAEVRHGGLIDRDDERDLQLFKSVGTALQDLALADAVHALALQTGRGVDLGDVVSLKPFASKAPA